MRGVRGFALGLAAGVVLTAGIGAATGGGEWGQAPMNAKVGTHLYREGWCKHPKRMTPVQVFSPHSAMYQCKPTFKPPAPP